VRRLSTVQREATRDGGTLTLVPLSLPALGSRSADGAGSGKLDPDDYLGLLRGHFAVFNQWTEIDSSFEGRFMERIAPGAFKKTFEENGSNIRCLLNHGRDPQIGSKVLGKPRTLEEDSEGAAYEVPLYRNANNELIIDGLRDDQFGASFRFRVIREEVNGRPGRSDFNPQGLEERSTTEAAVIEFGPVTFPAYQAASAGIAPDAARRSAALAGVRSRSVVTSQADLDRLQERHLETRRAVREMQRRAQPWRIGPPPQWRVFRPRRLPPREGARI
jgi:HK97 family phage prohead protease